MPLLSHKLPLDSMFIAPCQEQNRAAIKPRIACWCSPLPASGRRVLLPDLQRESWFCNKAEQPGVITVNYLIHKEDLVSVAKHQTQGGS